MDGHSEQRILGFNGLRAVAVALVFVQHKAHSDAVDFGQLGVWLFFALSGFLIIGILHRQKLASESGVTTFRGALKRFFYRRAMRIFPAYYLVLALSAAALASASILRKDHLVSMFVGGWDGMLWHATYMSNFFMGVHLHRFAGRMAHLWSLSVEEQFYLIFAPLLLVMPGRHHVKLCLITLAIGIATQVLFRVYQAQEVFAYTFPINNFAVMAAGGICCFAQRQTGPRGGTSNWPITLALLLLCVALFRKVAFDGELPALTDGALDVGMMFGCALAVMWVSQNQQSAVVSALEWKPLEYLGRISYGFYLYHNFIPDLGQSRTISRMLGQQPGSFAVEAVGLVVSFAISAGIAHLSWRYFEQPITRLKNRATRRASLVGETSLAS